MSWELIASIIAAPGVWEGVKYLLNRKTNKRVAVAEASLAEVNVFQQQIVVLQNQVAILQGQLENAGKTIDFYQEQLQEKEERFAKQTEIVRDLQSELFKEKDLRHDAEMELATKRCNDIPCPYRRPPTSYTGEPPSGVNIHEYKRTQKLLHQ